MKMIASVFRQGQAKRRLTAHGAAMRVVLHARMRSIFDRQRQADSTDV
jgi:hypothetical protein